MSLKIGYAGSTDIGGRTSQQDDYLLAPDSTEASSTRQAHLFAVFDGHGSDGAKCSSMLKSLLLQHISSRIAALETDPVTCLTEVFSVVHEELISNPAIDSYMSGSTASMALITKTNIITAHLGDSRAMVGVKGDTGWKLDFVSKDHTCEDPDEYKRVSATGARIERLDVNDGPLRIFKGSLPYPGIVVTRAFGDTVATRLGILTTPSVSIHPLHVRPIVVILGTDGVWDGITPEEALAVAIAHEDDAERASLEITQASLRGMDRNQLDDNTTNVVIFIN
ncbi:phosphatase 2C-like domain-containing protein [Phlyctochytrium arcticum]|nr:phosphatase 2C-like domain-containing protein [Phlyctochytrium arcticum]